MSIEPSQMSRSKDPRWVDCTSFSVKDQTIARIDPYWNIGDTDLTIKVVYTDVDHQDPSPYLSHPGLRKGFITEYRSPGSNVEETFDVESMKQLQGTIKTLVTMSNFNALQSLRGMESRDVSSCTGQVSLKTTRGRYVPFTITASMPDQPTEKPARVWHGNIKLNAVEPSVATSANVAVDADTTTATDTDKRTPSRDTVAGSSVASSLHDRPTDF